MQLEDQYIENSNSITHSPYYGCVVRVISKVNVTYEGVLDGISINKDRIFLKNVRVKGNINNSSDPINSIDTLNAVMIDHLTNDMHIYEQVCLNVRDIQELKLIRLPSTFHESKAKLYAIDPCLVDIRLSPSDEHENMSNESINNDQHPLPIARHSREESLGSTGSIGALISSSSNESSSSLNYYSNENHEKLFDEQINRFSRLSTTNNNNNNNNNSSTPVTLLAKKVLPKKIERNNGLPVFPQNHFTSNQSNTIKKSSNNDNRRKLSPIRVTITSNLNPNAVPFYGQQRSIPTTQNSTLTFYERKRFQPHLQPVISPDHSKSVNRNNNHQRFIPPRQMAIKKNFNNQQSSTTNRQNYSSSFSNRQSYPQQQTKNKTSSHEQIPGLMQQTSSTIIDQILSTPPMRERLSVPINKRPRQTPAMLSSTASLPYQNRHSGDFNQIQFPLSFGEPIGSHRGQRTISGTSSGSSLSVDIGPHSILQLDSTSNLLTSVDGQYDFEKANEEFRRYLELEELVTRRASSACSTGSHSDDNNLNLLQSQGHAYKKEISFFDRISCTATTGTAVAYTEQDEAEKNRETFGDDALLINAELNDNEWQI